MTGHVALHKERSSSRPRQTLVRPITLETEADRRNIIDFKYLPSVTVLVWPDAFKIVSARLSRSAHVLASIGRSSVRSAARILAYEIDVFIVIMIDKFACECRHGRKKTRSTHARPQLNTPASARRIA